MSITFNYEIISVSEAAKVMEVIYTAEGRQTLHIGARLPYVGESVEDVIRMFAPVSYWIEQEREVVVPVVGVTGTIRFELVPTPTPPSGAIPVTEF